MDAAHRKYGTFVRLQPDHVSVADAGAIGVVYGHGGGWVKRLVFLRFFWFLMILCWGGLDCQCDEIYRLPFVL